MRSWIIIETTAETADALRTIATALIEDRLCACAQVDGPIESHYRWKGQIEFAREFRLSIKTSEAMYAQVESRIRELHPYEVPQIVAIPVIHTSEAYGDWLQDCLKGNSSRVPDRPRD